MTVLVGNSFLFRAFLIPHIGDPEHSRSHLCLQVVEHALSAPAHHAGHRHSSTRRDTAGISLPLQGFQLAFHVSIFYTWCDLERCLLSACSRQLIFERFCKMSCVLGLKSLHA
eukprot:3128304-Amphidinium_carterae.1